jgi:hypothetical protein
MDRRSSSKRWHCRRAGCQHCARGSRQYGYSLASGFELSQVAGHHHGAAGCFQKAVRDPGGSLASVHLRRTDAHSACGRRAGSTVGSHTRAPTISLAEQGLCLGCAVPFGLNSRQITAWMVVGNGSEADARVFYAKPSSTLIGGNTGAQMGGWYRKKENQDTSRHEGLKMRIGGLPARSSKPWGRSPEHSG